jgi:hypothetical protein
VNTHKGQGEAGAAQPNEPPLPPTLAQAIASILKSRDEQTKLLCQLVNNSTRGGNGVRNAQGQAPTTYADFMATRPPTFTEAGELLEADHWLRTIESMFGLLCCTEHQKTLFEMQQLLGNVGAWWANFTAALPANHQVQWTEFREAFRAQHIPVGIMLTKHQDFMDLRQGRRSVHDYSKLFNHLA